MGKISIRDVAKHAGVSISAVSLAYNKPHQLSEATRKKIFTVAEQLGYSPHTKVHQESKLIVLAVPTDQALKQFVSTFTYAIIQQLSDHIYKPITVSYKSLDDYQEQLKLILHKEQVEGMIVVVNNTEQEIKRTNKIPTIIVSANTVGEFIDIGLDFMTDIEDMLKDFKHNDKKNIAVITSHILFNDLYIQNYVKAFEKRYQEYFDIKFNADHFCLLSENRSDVDILSEFSEQIKPDAWIIIGDYALNCIQYVVTGQVEGFVLMEEGKAHIKFPSNKLVVLERPNSQIVQLTVSSLLNLIHNHESAPKSKTVLFSKKIY